MSTDTEIYTPHADKGIGHSAFAEFNRDERRPAVLLLGALVIAALFFAIGIFVGRLMSTQNIVAIPQSKIEIPANTSSTPLP